MQGQPLEATQVAHIAKLSLLAMCARAVGASEFDTSPEVVEVHLVVSRSAGHQPDVELIFVGANDTPLTGMTL